MSFEEAAASLGGISRAAVVLPAGHGKTELIARVVRNSAEANKRILVLTHTNAGVAALRRRFVRNGIPPAGIQLSTIDGWMKRLAEAFPSIAECEVVAQDGTIDWAKACVGARKVIASPQLASRIGSWFDLIVVDEVQDCTELQFESILAHSSAAGLVVLGDPVQSVFDFGGVAMINWREQLAGFATVKVEAEPWRWKQANPTLGEDLVRLRAAIADRSKFDLRDTSIRIEECGVNPKLEVCWRLLRSEPEASATVLRQWPKECERTAKALQGRFPMMEEIEGKAVSNVAREVDRGPGMHVAQELSRFVSAAFSKLPANWATHKAAIKAGRFASHRPGKLHVFLTSLEDAARSPTPATLQTVMREVELLGGTLVRRFAWDELTRASLAWNADQQIPLSGHLRVARAQLATAGVSAPRRTVSRVRLVKGLEFDHAIVVQALLTTLSPQEVYVALTRGSKSTTVYTDSPVLDFSTADVAGFH